MQKFILFLFILVVLICSCSNNNKPDDSYLEVSFNQLFFWAEGGYKFVGVNSNREFSASSGSNWCTTEILTASKDNLKITVSKNDVTGEERTAEITVSCDGLEEKVKVTQLAAEQILTVKETSVVINEKESLSFTLTVTASIPVVFEFPAWIHENTADGSSGEEKKYSFTVSALNAGEISRSGEITVKPADTYSVKDITIPVMLVKGSVRVMSYNIQNARGMDNIVSYQRIADIISGVAPDVVALQELDSVTVRSNGVDVLVRLADLTDMYSVYGASILFNGGKYGIGVLSKEKPLSWKRIPLPGREEARSLLIVEFNDFVFCCTHFSLNAQDRLTSVGVINQAVMDFDKPVLLGGDLNDSPTSNVLGAFRQNWSILSDVTQITYPSDNPDENTIDYIFGYASKGYAYHVWQARVLNEPVASDHLPIFAEVSVIR